MNASEASIIATLLWEYPNSLPPNIEKLMRHAPESFYDTRFGAVAVAIRETVQAGEAVNVVTVKARLKRKWDPSAMPGPESVLPIDLCEAEAETVWKVFHTRRLQSLFSDAQTEIELHPDQVEVIASIARQSIELLEQETTRPGPMPWLDIEGDSADILIGPGRWLTRGSGVFLVSQTGSGKSTWCATQSFSFGLGRDSLGMCPVRPLKSLIFQAEDDSGDLALMRKGIIDVRKPSPEEFELLRQNVLVVTERGQTGLDFLKNLVAPLLRETGSDLLWINPLSAFFGDDLNNQQVVARFFRNTLNPILADTGAGAFVIHHTPKPSKERAAWDGGTLAYFGAGSADLANWSRETLSLKQTIVGLFEMTATKRWRQLGWRDAEGRPSQEF